MRLANAPDVLTVPEVARLLRLNRNTVYDLIRSKALYAARIGHSLRVPRAALEEFLDGAGPDEDLHSIG